LTLAKYGTLIVIGLLASSSIVAIELLTYVGLLNLTLGNIIGLLQFRYQRIIVYSSLIQIGYILLVISNSSSLGLGYFELYSFYTVLLLILWIVPTYNELNSGRLLPSVQL
jgi:NADH:ubiquinone oxidoreductase subunit 2 (subunit N)